MENKKGHHSFENEIFSHFRKEQEAINRSIDLLKKHGYIIYETETKKL